jgi:hypothetical protein
MKNLLERCWEPTLEEILADEIVGAMMAADRVDRHELEAMLTEVARNRDHGAPLQPSGEPVDAGGAAVE